MDIIVNFFIAFIEKYTFLTIVFTLFIIWGWINWKALNDKERPDSFEHRIKLLKEDHFGKLYQSILGYFLDTITRWIGDKKNFENSQAECQSKNSWICKTFKFNPWSEPSFKITLVLAFFYPIISFFIFWTCGSDGTFAGIDYLVIKNGEIDIPDATRWLYLLVFVSVTMVLIWLLKRKTKYHEIGLIAIIFLVLYFMGYAFVIVGIVAITMAGVGVGVGIVGVIVAVAGFFAGFFAFDIFDAALFSNIVSVFAGTLAGFFVGFFVSVVVLLDNLYKKFHKNSLFWVYYITILIVVSYVAIDSLSVNGKIFILFYLLLPLINAPLDWLSLGTTRGLLQAIRSGHHPGWQGFVWGLADLVIALIFLLLMSSIAVVVFTLSGVTDVPAFLNGLKMDDINNHWIYFMIFSTLIPTLIHFIVASSALTLWLSQAYRNQIITRMDKSLDKIIWAWVYLSVTPFLGILLPIGFIYTLFWILIPNFGKVVGEYLITFLIIVSKIA